MKTFLDEILSCRRRQVAEDRATNDSQQLRRRAEEIRAGRARHRLGAALQKNQGIGIIGEFKRASPSLGEIRRDADPAEVARLYAAAGVCAISVLTEPEFFGGSLEDLRRVRAVADLPILRKDFIVDEYQIDEAAIAGADAILLIVAALTCEELARFRARAEDELGLDALIEVHSAAEMKCATNLGATLIGVNNRDLRTFSTSLETSKELAPFAPAGATLISESGIASPADIRQLAQCGYRGFLIGESLMRAPDPGAFIRELRGVEQEEHV